MKSFNRNSILTAFVLSFVFGLTGIVMAATSVNLAAADNFAVLAGSTVTNTGTSVINGDLGLSPGTSVTGFPPGILNGTQYVANTTAAQAKTDLITAYNDALGQTPVSIIATELGGRTLTPGTYSSESGTFGITGTLTLDGQGNPNAVFIFKTASTLITAGASDVLLINGAQACNVFWQVGSSATLGSNSVMKGNILSSISATLNTGARVEGRVLAQSGAVTLDTNIITKATCVVPPPAPVPAPTPAPTPTPTPIPTPTPTPVPQLPNTGIAPDEKTGAPWNIIIPAGVFAALLSFYLARKERTS